MLSPKRTKYRKQHKGRIKGMAKGGTELNFGAYGLKATSPGRVSVARSKPRAITRHMRRVELDPHFPMSPSPRSRRKCAGSAGLAGWWATRVKPGRIMFELDRVSRKPGGLRWPPPNCRRRFVSRIAAREWAHEGR